MKNVKFAVAAFAFLFTVAGAQAQELKKMTPAKENVELKKDKETLEAELKLTPEQKTKMGEIRKKYAVKAREVKSAQQDERKKQMLALHSERDAEVKALLTADQYKTYVEFREKRKAARKEGRGEKK